MEVGMRKAEGGIRGQSAWGMAHSVMEEWRRGGGLEGGSRNAEGGSGTRRRPKRTGL